MTCQKLPVGKSSGATTAAVDAAGAGAAVFSGGAVGFAGSDPWAGCVVGCGALSVCGAGFSAAGVLWAGAGAGGNGCGRPSAPVACCAGGVLSAVTFPDFGAFCPTTYPIANATEHSST